MTQLQECLANNMKRYRKLCRFSQEKLAEKAGASANYIALIESGKNFPSLQMIENIAQALNVNAIDLFDKNSMSFPMNEDLRKKLLEQICNVINTTFDETMTASE